MLAFSLKKHVVHRVKIIYHAYRHVCLWCHRDFHPARRGATTKREIISTLLVLTPLSSSSVVSLNRLLLTTGVSARSWRSLTVSRDSWSRNSRQLWIGITLGNNSTHSGNGFTVSSSTTRGLVPQLCFITLPHFFAETPPFQSRTPT